MLVSNRKLDHMEADAAAGRPYDESNGNWKTFQSASIGLYVAGGAAVVGGAVAFLLGRSNGSGETTVASSLVISPVPQGAVLGGRF